MPASTIYVNRGGRPASGIRVMLSFATGGVTPEARTDSQGRALISHTATGTATIFVDGRRRHSIRAPGTATVEI